MALKAPQDGGRRIEDTIAYAGRGLVMMTGGRRVGFRGGIVTEVVLEIIALIQPGNEGDGLGARAEGPVGGDARIGGRSKRPGVGARRLGLKLCRVANTARGGPHETGIGRVSLHRDNDSDQSEIWRPMNTDEPGLEAKSEGGPELSAVTASPPTFAFIRVHRRLG